MFGVVSIYVISENRSRNWEWEWEWEWGEGEVEWCVLWLLDSIIGASVEKWSQSGSQVWLVGIGQREKQGKFG